MISRATLREKQTSAAGQVGIAWEVPVMLSTHTYSRADIDRQNGIQRTFLRNKLKYSIIV